MNRLWMIFEVFVQIKPIKFTNSLDILAILLYYIMYPNESISIIVLLY